MPYKDVKRKTENKIAKLSERSYTQNVQMATNLLVVVYVQNHVQKALETMAYFVKSPLHMAEESDMLGNSEIISH